MQVFTLTKLTRESTSQRRVVIQGFDLPLRGLMVVGLAFIPAVIVTAILWRLIGDKAVLAIPVVELAAFWLIESRSRSGLRLRQYQNILDTRRSLSGKFLCCGVRFDPLVGEWIEVVASSAPAQTPSAAKESESVRWDEAFETEVLPTQR